VESLSIRNPTHPQPPESGFGVPQIYIHIRAFITAHLKANPCVDCGETDPVILEFDHLKTKDFNISDAARKGVSIKKLNDEIAKCEVRCANCHRRKTYERSGLTHKD
jgi:hypothetical protein